MVHLMVHLPREVKLVGPVSYRWMYPFERSILKFVLLIYSYNHITYYMTLIFIKIFVLRNLYTLKKYVRNKARPKGSIAKAYTVNEALIFCSMYLSGILIEVKGMKIDLKIKHKDVFPYSHSKLNQSVVDNISNIQRKC